MSRDATFDRPVKAKLVVRLENGDEFEPTEEDLREFDLVDPGKAYQNFCKHLRKIVGEDNDLCGGDLSMLRYFVERSVYHYGHEHLGDFTCDDDDETYELMEQVLRKITWED